MRELYRAVGLVLCTVLPLFGQQKVQPPPTRMTLPSDTVQMTTTQQSTTAESEKPELELPEVLIQGTDRIVRLKSEKETVVPDNPTLVKPQTPPQIINSWFTLQSTKPQYQTGGPVIHNSTWGHLQGGSYASFAGDLGHWQELGRLRLHGRGWLDRSTGQYLNSQHSWGGLDLESDYHMSNKLTTSLQGEYRQSNLGLQEAALLGETRSGGSGTLEAGLGYDLAKNTTAHARLHFGTTRLTSDTNATNLDRTNDSWYEASGEVVSQILGLQLGAQGRYLGENLRQSQTSLKKTASFGEAGLESLFPISAAVSAGMGVNYHMVKVDSAQAVNRFSPYGRINIVPGNWLGISATVYSGYNYETFTKRWQDNPYVSHLLPLRPEETSLGTKASVDFQMTEALGFHAGFNYAEMTTLYYWQQDPATGYFTQQNTGDVRLLEFQGGTTWQPGDWLELQASVATYAASFPDTSALAAYSYLPYRPQIRVPVQAILHLPSKFQLTMEGEIMGPREIDFSGGATLPGYDLLNATISRDFGQKFTVSLSATNLFNESYVDWEQYFQPGIRVFLGVKAKF